MSVFSFSLSTAALCLSAGGSIFDIIGRHGSGEECSSGEDAHGRVKLHVNKVYMWRAWTE